MKKKDFAEAGALYFIATLFNKGIGFVTVPIFSRILTTSDYGTVTTFNSWVSMISVFISLALYNAVRNSFVDMDDKERPHFLSTIITFTGLVFLTVMGVCVVATVFVPRNIILIPKYGYVAAAYTTLASYFVAFILHSRYAKKIEPDIYPLKMFALPLLHVGGAIILYYPLLNFWTLRWGILFVYLIIVLIKERFRIGTLVPVLAEKCSFFKEKQILN